MVLDVSDNKFEGKRFATQSDCFLYSTETLDLRAIGCLQMVVLLAAESLGLSGRDDGIKCSRVYQPFDLVSGVVHK